MPSTGKKGWTTRSFFFKPAKKAMARPTLLEKEMDLAKVNQELFEVDSFIEAVKAKRETLA